jgi:hypothetical protein
VTGVGITRLRDKAKRLKNVSGGRVCGVRPDDTFEVGCNQIYQQMGNAYCKAFFLPDKLNF